MSAPATADIPVVLLTMLDDRDLGFALGPVVGSAIAFSVGASMFAPQIAGILSGAGLPPEAVAGLL